VDDLNAEQIREYRGTLTQPGKNSPWRNRSIEENLALFNEMKQGKFKNGEKVLRAKIDMASPNINMRDPVIYRILHENHHATGNKWCIYPMYDYAHPLEDAIEGITHSLCTLEFEDHRPFYNWALENLDDYKNERPEQTEFARLNLTRTIMSKRYLKRLVDEKVVNNWDDPRMPTICGLRRRGYTPESIRDFCERIGLAKRNSTVDAALLEFCLREDLNKKALRKMAVIDPLKLVITNYPQGTTEYVECLNNPEDESAGTRVVPFSRELYIEQEDFMEIPFKKFHRLSPGKEIRLKHAYYITCTDFVKDESGKVIQVNCTYDPESKGGWTKDGRKVKGTSHWVSKKHAVPAQIRIYDYLLKPQEEIKEGSDFFENLNPGSMTIIDKAFIEPGFGKLIPGTSYQFLRLGYFCVDPDSTPEKPVFNRSVTLKDTWAKLKKKASV
jgi:glutaminyl-tRNA synthetase